MWLSNCFALNPLHYTSRIGANNERYNKSIHSLFTATHTQRTIWQRELGNRRGTFGRTTLYFRDSIISLIKKKQNRDQTCLTSRPARLRLPIPVHQPGRQPSPSQLSCYTQSLRRPQPRSFLYPQIAKMYLHSFDSVNSSLSIKPM